MNLQFRCCSLLLILSTTMSCMNGKLLGTCWFIFTDQTLQCSILHVCAIRIKIRASMGAGHQATMQFVTVPTGISH